MDSNLHIGDKEYVVRVEHRKQSKTCPEYAAITITIPTEMSREEIVIFFNDMGGGKRLLYETWICRHKGGTMRPAGKPVVNYNEGVAHEEPIFITRGDGTGA